MPGKQKSRISGRGYQFTNQIEASVYDTKPVHCISMVSEELKWSANKKEWFNIDTDQVLNWYSYAWTTSGNTILKWKVLKYMRSLRTNMG